MRHVLMIAVAVALLGGASTAARAQSPDAQSPDKNPACRGPDGKFATAASCKGAGPAPAVADTYKLDAQGKCRDAKGQMAKKEMCVGKAKP